MGGIMAGIASLAKGLRGLFSRGKKKREAAAQAARDAAAVAAKAAEEAAVAAAQDRSGNGGYSPRIAGYADTGCYGRLPAIA